MRGLLEVYISRLTPVKIFRAPAASKYFPQRNPTFVSKGTHSPHPAPRASWGPPSRCGCSARSRLHAAPTRASWGPPCTNRPTHPAPIPLHHRPHNALLNHPGTHRGGRAAAAAAGAGAGAGAGAAAAATSCAAAAAAAAAVGPGGSRNQFWAGVPLDDHVCSWGDEGGRGKGVRRRM